MTSGPDEYPDARAAAERLREAFKAPILPSSAELPDYFCAKCKHGLRESQTTSDACSILCPKCRGPVDTTPIPNEPVPMFAPKVARPRVEVKVGEVKIENTVVGTAKDGKRVRSENPFSTGALFDTARSIVLIEKLLAGIADRLENDGVDPVDVMGTTPGNLWLLGDALVAIGRTEAAEIAYQASKDHDG